MKSEHSKRALCLAALAVLSLSLAGCEAIRNAAGISKEAPDEFAVVTKAPLVVPPDYNLRPPRPGAAPTNQASPTGAAQAALFSDDPNAIQQSLGTGYSDEEKAILASSGGAIADHSIRQEIASDAKSMEGADQSFTDSILFGGGSTADAGRAVNADAEKQRIDAAKASGQTTPGGGQAPAAQTTKSDGSATIQKKDDSGWFGGIF
ncbi:MAG: DUF3035 domain-containing protein [Rhizomicrobium sp.]|jgi:hypothetical protein